MKFIYYSILYIIYKYIQLWQGGKLWSASSASLSLSGAFTIALHITIGETIGLKFLNSFNSVGVGIFLIITITLVNIFLFVRNKKYLEIEKYFDSNKRRKRMALLIFLIFASWVVAMFILAFH